MSESFDNTRPIGLIDSTWGGTLIEFWISQRVSNFCLTPASEDDSESALWNAMIAPLSKTAVRGAIWYQGESNVGWNDDYYSCHLAAMAQDWRKTFVDGDVQADNGIAFPFGVVQVKKNVV
jgi:sialate O-acetylesterase